MNIRNENKEIAVAVVGRSSAYSNLTRAMTDMGFHVKKWTGSAEDSGTLCDIGGRRLRLVLLPGPRALSPRTREERVVRDYLVSGKPDLILNVADATDLERDLFLTIRLMELGLPLVMALNRVDIVETRGVRIDVPALEMILQGTVVPMASRRKNDPELLMRELLAVADNPATGRPRQFKYGNDVECAAEFIETAIGLNQPELVKRYPSRWLAYKVMEGDPSVQGDLMASDGSMVAEAMHQRRRVHGEDLAAHLAAVRDGLACNIAREVLGNAWAGRAELAEMIERGGLSRFLTPPIFLAAMALLFSLALRPSVPFGG